jgi:hypothetical protein
MPSLRSYPQSSSVEIILWYGTNRASLFTYINLLEKDHSYTEINNIHAQSTVSIAIITTDNTSIHPFVYIAAFEG